MARIPDALFAIALAGAAPATGLAQTRTAESPAQSRVHSVDPLTVNGHQRCKAQDKACYQAVLGDWFVARPDEVYRVSQWCVGIETSPTKNLSDNFVPQGPSMTGLVELSPANKTFCGIVQPHGSEARRRLEAIARLSRELKSVSGK